MMRRVFGLLDLLMQPCLFERMVDPVLEMVFHRKAAKPAEGRDKKGFSHRPTRTHADK